MTFTAAIGTILTLAALYGPADRPSPNASSHDAPSPDGPSKCRRECSVPLAISRQLAGGCSFVPECPVFFCEAVKADGFFPALIFTADRITRSTRIGSAGRGFFPSSNGRRHEGLEAYHPKRMAPVLMAAPMPVSADVPVPALASAQAPISAPATDPISPQLDFVNYLIDSDLKRDAWVLLDQPRWAPSDTLDYLRGKVAFSLKELPSAEAAFDLVQPSSPFYEEAMFHNVVACAHLGQLDKAAELLHGYSGTNVPLANLQRAGIALLKRDTSSYLEASSSFDFSNYALADSEHGLQDVYNGMQARSRKRPGVAALMSAVLPGSGKIYAGKTGEGISAFIFNGTLAALTAENAVKAGPLNWKTLLFGTCFSIFYIGNIYGSYVSVSIYNNDLQNAFDTAVLYHIHIPLRSVFR